MMHWLVPLSLLQSEHRGNFTIKYPTAPCSVFVFGLSLVECGFLSIAPDEDTCNQVFNQVVKALNIDCDWSLLRLYQLQLEPWDGVIDNVQSLLEHIEELVETDFAVNFRQRLQVSDLLYVLLIRRRGLHWERVGSGLMFERNWPSTSKETEVRAYEERIALI